MYEYYTKPIVGQYDLRYPRFVDSESDSVRAAWVGMLSYWTYRPGTDTKIREPGRKREERRDRGQRRYRRRHRRPTGVVEGLLRSFGSQHRHQHWPTSPSLPSSLSLSFPLSFLICFCWCSKSNAQTLLVDCWYDLGWFGKPCQYQLGELIVEIIYLVASPHWPSGNYGAYTLWTEQFPKA